MRSTLEELFYGNICPNTDCRSHNKETKQLMAYIAERAFRLYFRKGTGWFKFTPTHFTHKKSGIKRFPIFINYMIFTFYPE